MIFRKKSKFEKASDAVVSVLETLGSPGRRQRGSRYRRAQQGMGLLSVAGSIAWVNREKIKKAADSALHMAQERLEASKQALAGGGSENKPENKKEEQQQQPEQQSQQPQQQQQQPQSQQQAQQPQQQQPADQGKAA